tara:strand:+ start:3044 stop:3166 length:123 start_codon:yes stop_codon:yes gene_type:complete
MGTSILHSENRSIIEAWNKAIKGAVTIENNLQLSPTPFID